MYYFEASRHDDRWPWKLSLYVYKFEQPLLECWIGLDIRFAASRCTLEDGGVVYGKPLIFTKETVGKYNF